MMGKNGDWAASGDAYSSTRRGRKSGVDREEGRRRRVE